MRDRLILYGLPILCGLCLALAMFGPGAERPAKAARVYGVPVAGALRFALAIEAVAEQHGLEAPSPGDLALQIRAGDRAIAAWQGFVAADTGFAEADGALSEPLPKDAMVRVVRGAEVLAQGHLQARGPLPAEDPARCQESDGAIRINVCVLRGVVVPEFPERVRIAVLGGQGSGEPVIDARVAGGDILHFEKDGPDVCGAGPCFAMRRLDVVVRAPAAALDVQVQIGATKGEFHVDLPLQPGGVWLDPGWPAERALELKAATEKEVVYASLLGAHGRLWGGSAPMQPDGRGGSSASLRLPEGIADLGAAPYTLLVASDPGDPEGRVTPWPLGDAMVQPTRMALLLDGLPRAVAAEQRRMRRVRWPVGGLILASAAAVLLTLALRARRAREALERHLRAQGGAAAAQAARVPLGLAIVVAAALALAFAVMAAMAALGGR